MPRPTVCRNPACPNHRNPSGTWYRRHGFYCTSAFGRVQRYCCKACRRTVSSQTESTHYYSKQPLPFSRVARLLASRSMRDVARECRVSGAVIRNHVLRIGRQCMAAHVHMLAEMPPRSIVAFDGLRSFVTSQDYPCDITTVVDSESDTILTMVHSIFLRGGTKTPLQKKRIEEKYAVWRPAKGSVKRDITLLVNEMVGYLKLDTYNPAVVHTDEHHIYRRVMREGKAGESQRRGLLVHRTTSSLAPRTQQNALFPVNYVDLLMRHREKEHTRETIAFGRHSVVQMHRAWIWVWDHNMQREYRVRRPELGTHAEQGIMTSAAIRRIMREFWGRRLTVRGKHVPESIQAVWRGSIPTPPVRWKNLSKKETAAEPTKVSECRFWKMRIPGDCITDLSLQGSDKKPVAP